MHKKNLINIKLTKLAKQNIPFQITFKNQSNRGRTLKYQTKMIIITNKTSKKTFSKSIIIIIIIITMIIEYYDIFTHITQTKSIISNISLHKSYQIPIYKIFKTIILYQTHLITSSKAAVCVPQIRHSTNTFI